MSVVGYCSEIFSAIQGEGVMVGARQIFVRAAGCNIRCDYCDQPESLVRTPECAVEQTPGGRDFVRHPNPRSVEDTTRDVERLHRVAGLHQWVSFTGGEPLVQPEFLAEVMPRVRELGLRTYLETNGVLSDALARVIPHTDFVSMDWKIPSSGATPPFWEKHEAFLRGFGLALGQVKIVVSAGTEEGEYRKSLDLIAGIRPDVPLVLQPLTPFGEARGEPSPEKMLRFQELASEALSDVRVIPQTHKMIGQR